MPDNHPLPPDPDAVEQWEQMAKGDPSHKALPPATGGTRVALWLFGGAGLIALIALLFGR